MPHICEAGKTCKENEMKKHCDKCSHQTEEGLAISGCDYCGCHVKKTWNCHAGVSHEVGCPHKSGKPTAEEVWVEEFDKQFTYNLQLKNGNNDEQWNELIFWVRINGLALSAICMLLVFSKKI